jgi:hypothetical protein
MSTYDEFWKLFVAAFKRLPVWLPGTEMAVGDIGVLDRRGWRYLTSLDKLGIPFQVRRAESGISYSRTSGNGVRVDAIATADLGPAVPGMQVMGGMKVTFDDGGAFVARAENCHHDVIDTPDPVEAELQRREPSEIALQGRRWILVSEITTAEPAIMLIAHQSGASASVRFDAAAGATTLAALAGGKGSVSLSQESFLEDKIVSPSRVPLMWRGRRRRGWLRRGLGDLDKPGDVLLEPAGPGLVDFRPDPHDIPDRDLADDGDLSTDADG